MMPRHSRRVVMQGALGVGAAVLMEEAATARAESGLRDPTLAERKRYSFLPKDCKLRGLNEVFAAPPGTKRVALSDDSFGAYLRGIPLRAHGTAVRSFRGEQLLEATDARVAAVAELDVSAADVQQCADSIIRYHAEWLWSLGRKQAIGYHFVSGDYASYTRYAAGERPSVQGKRVIWEARAKPADSRSVFRSYLDMVFNYASTLSLAARTVKVDRTKIAPGDFFILPGGPGHCVLVLDMAMSDRGECHALLGQGFMPAQDFHVLLPAATATDVGSPWFSLARQTIVTPFWEPFPWSSLRRFPPPSEDVPKNRR